MPHFAIRRVVLEYGAVPIASWLHHIDSVSALSYALVDMRKGAVVDGSRCECSHPRPVELLQNFAQHRS